MCTHTHAQMYLLKHACGSLHTFTHAQTCLHVHRGACMHTLVHILHTCPYGYLHTCTHMHMCPCPCAHTCTHIYTHTCTRELESLHTWVLASPYIPVPTCTRAHLHIYANPPPTSLPRLTHVREATCAVHALACTYMCTLAAPVCSCTCLNTHAHLCTLACACTHAHTHMYTVAHTHIPSHTHKPLHARGSVPGKPGFPSPGCCFGTN